jgi:hypothetical protein
LDVQLLIVRMFRFLRHAKRRSLTPKLNLMG